MMKMDDRDSAECQNWEKRDINVIFRKVFKSLKDKTLNSSSSPTLSQKKREMGSLRCRSFFFKFFLEREPLLSSNTGDPTVGSLWDKKESCSTRRGLHVGTGFREFPQTL